MTERAIVCDTSLLLYLGRIDQLHLLPALFGPIFVPDIVALELDAGRLLRSDTVDPASLAWAKLVPVTEAAIARLPANRLGAGERAVIACALEIDACIAGLDDRQARMLAQQLGLRVVGTVGLLLAAKRAGSVALVATLLNDLQRQGFRLTAEVYAEAIRLAGEDANL